MRNSITLALPLLLALGACGDSGGGGGESKNALPASSGLEAEKKVNTLSDADLKKLCAYANKGDDGLDPTKACEAYAAQITDTKQDCDGFAQLCELGEPEDNDCSHVSADLLKHCDQTVAAVEDCLKADAAAAVQFTNTTSCADAGKAKQPVVSDKCQQIKADCAMIEGEKDPGPTT